MKTAEEWERHPAFDTVDYAKAMKVVREIQADALRHAANIAENQTRAAERLEEEAERIERGTTK